MNVYAFIALATIAAVIVTVAVALPYFLRDWRAHEDAHRRFIDACREEDDR